MTRRTTYLAKSHIRDPLDIGRPGNWSRMALKVLPHHCPTCHGDLVEIRAIGTPEFTAACVNGCPLTPAQQHALHEQPSRVGLVA